MKKILLLILALVFLVSPISLASDTFVPPPRTLTRLEDDGNLLTDSQEAELREKLDRISEERQVDVVIKTTNTLEGKSPRAYADDYFDYEGFGLGENYDGILLMISMEDRDWWISTHGFGITAFTDKGLDYISDKFLSDLSDGNYYDSFNTFADLADKFILQAQTGEPYDKGNMPKNEITPTILIIFIIVSLVVGLIVAFSILHYMKKTHKTIRKAQFAGDYALGVASFINITDRFYNKTVTRTRKPSESSSSGGGGGSSTHTSSSGRSHGGSGGKF